MVRMADEESPYQRLVKEIAALEATAQRTENADVDISSMFQPTAASSARKYGELLVAIGKIEGGWAAITVQRPRAQPAPAKPAARVVPPQVAVQAAPQKPAPQQLQPSVQRTKVEAKKELEGFAKSLQGASSSAAAQATQKAETAAKGTVSGIAGGFGHIAESIGEIKLKRINTKDLVLPNLSLSDQVEELQRIIDGLRSGMFNEDELGVVVQEVYGLRQQVDDEKKELRKRKSEQSQDEFTLWTLRDQRLADAISLIEKKGA